MNQTPAEPHADTPQATGHLPLEGMVDTHFHCLEMQRKGIDIPTLMDELAAAGFAGGMDIGISADDLPTRATLLAPYPSIKLAAGIGPWGAQEGTDIQDSVARLATGMAENRLDCIGEIGLDYHWNYGTRQRQETLFCMQLELAQSLRLPVCIHSRNADDHMHEILASTTLDYGGIMHCFSSTIEMARTALDANLMISFAGTITYKNNHVLREVLRYVPEDRLLLETDSPYLSPHPHRGTTNTPRHMDIIHGCAARERSLDKPVTKEEIASRVRANFQQLFAAS